MTKSRAAALLVALVSLAAVLVITVRGRGAGIQEVARPDREGVVSVELDGYRFVPPVMEIPAERPVRIVFTNNDDVVHDLSVGRVVAEDDGPIGYVDDLFAGLSPDVRPSEAQVGPSSAFPHFTLSVRPGATAAVSVTFPRDRIGAWEVGCFTAGGCHYRAGLAATLEIVDG